MVKASEKRKPKEKETSGEDLSDNILEAVSAKAQGKSESGYEFITRVAEAFSELGDDEYKALDPDVKNWAQTAIKAISEKTPKDVPDLGDASYTDGHPKAKKAAAEDDEDEAPKPKSKKAAAEDDDEDEKPKSKSKKSDDDEDEKPKRRSRDDDEDEKPKSKKSDDDDDEKPKSKRKRDEEDDEDEKPKSKRSVAAEDDDEKPKSKSKKAAEEDDEDEKPKSKRKRDDDEDEKPAKKAKRAGGGTYDIAALVCEFPDASLEKLMKTATKRGVAEEVSEAHFGNVRRNVLVAIAVLKDEKRWVEHGETA